MNSGSRRLIIHIGQHKTGSTALQACLYGNQDHLARHGILYPVPGIPGRRLRVHEMNHYKLFLLLRVEAMALSGRREEASDLLASNRDYLAPHATVRSSLQSLLGECRPEASMVILSAEDLFDMHTAHEEGFSMDVVPAGARILRDEADFLGYEPTLVCYLRRQDHLLEAHYAQYIKGSDRNHPEFAEFASSFAPRLDSHAILSCWGNAFGQERLRVLPYEKERMPGGIVPDFFRNILGIDPPAVTDPFSENPESVNASPDRDSIDYIRILNNRNRYGKRTLDRHHVLKALLPGSRGGSRPESRGWLSPSARMALLERYRKGNLLIGQEYGDFVTKEFFKEPLPDAGETWEEFRGIPLSKMLEIDTAIRLAGGSRPFEQKARRSSGQGMLPGDHALVVVPTEPDPSESLAARMLEGVIGDPSIRLVRVNGDDAVKPPWLFCSNGSAGTIDRMLRRHATRIAYAVLVGIEHCHLAKKFWSHGIPVVLVVGQLPSDEEECRSLHKYSRYAGFICYPNEEIMREVRRLAPHTAAMESHFIGDADFMEARINSLHEARLLEKAQRRLLLKARALDYKFSYPWIGWRDKKLAIAEYTTAWRTGINRRKPRPGFHPGIYAEKQSLKEWSVDGDPFVHYLRSGKPEGPWSLPVIKPRMISYRQKSTLKSALHIHLFYPEMAEDIIHRLNQSASRPDLLISVPSERVVSQTKRHFGLMADRRVIFRIVPNSGRDIGALLTGFSDILQDYDVVGHVHSKQSMDYGDRKWVENTVEFLFENMLGGEKPMVDVILHAMKKDPMIGLVFPDDPHVFGWMGNRNHALALMERMGLGTDLPEKFINFPVGTMYWARPKALKPLFDLKLDWSDYPQEPIPPDGTILHAIERIIPLVSERSGYRNAVTYVRGVPR